MTREEIEAIRKRAEKATEGPWRVVPGKMVCFDIYDVYDKLDRSLIHREEDAKFIAHAREDIPKLLAEIERLQRGWGKAMTYLEQITKITGQLPLEVLIDINQRIGDWLASGGKEDDPYIQQQLRFAERFLKSTSRG
ncbi:hypothetical protein QZ287_13680 [Brevibacillus laterosporus]|nr:DUF6877 family protein [Brevibacillus laterosporus]MDN9011088.1 hypothetical protein [Brevibacillus laterosporus]MDO0942111.1 hypothetical protein [Brevibacillus laterosporus]